MNTFYRCIKLYEKPLKNLAYNFQIFFTYKSKLKCKKTCGV